MLKYLPFISLNSLRKTPLIVKLILFILVIMCLLKLFSILLTFFYVFPNSQARQVDVTHQVVFDIKIGDSEPQPVVIGVFGKVVPITAQNFVSIASGHKGLTYRGSIFHRVIPNFMIQGGDIVSHNGRGSVSIYGRKFNDENFDLKHSEPGMLSMANSGPDSNGSQFFVTTVTTPWLDGKHTVFGKVLQGFEIIKAVEALQTDRQDRPMVDVVIVNSSAQPVNQKIFLNQ